MFSRAGSDDRQKSRQCAVGGLNHMCACAVVPPHALATARIPTRRVLLAMLVWLFSVIPAASASAEDNAPLPEAPPYMLLPPNWPYPAFPTCATPYGVCRFPQDVPVGTPCSCLAANGVWVGGHITVNPLYPLLPQNPPAPPPQPKPSPHRPDKR